MACRGLRRRAACVCLARPARGLLLAHALALVDGKVRWGREEGSEHRIRVRVGGGHEESEHENSWCSPALLLAYETSS